jgi:hypothetical protein
MMWLLHSGLLSFTVALFIAVIGIKTWHLARNPAVAFMNGGFVGMNVAFGIAQLMTHPEIWQ